MNKLKTAIRNAEVDGLSDSIIRNFKADEKAQSDSFLKSALEELESLSTQITTAILQDKTLSTLDSADSARDEAVKTLGTVLVAYAVFPIASKKELSAPLKAIYDKYAKAQRPHNSRGQTKTAAVWEKRTEAAEPDAADGAAFEADLRHREALADRYGEGIHGQADRKQQQFDKSHVFSSIL